MSQSISIPGKPKHCAILAGNDVAEYVTDVDAAIKAIKKLVAQKKLTNADIDLKCRKVLAVKYWSGLSKPHPVQKENITKGNLFTTECSIDTRALC